MFNRGDATRATGRLSKSAASALVSAVALLIDTPLLLRVPVLAQEPPHAGTVRITFLPPPLEGILNIGIYTLEGKLVRTLAREATEKDFTVGLNGFITTWDGKDDAGMQLPAGRYFVRGYAIGVIQIEGIAFHGNDWISEEENSPRIADITAIDFDGADLLLAGRGVGSADCVIRVERDSGDLKFEPYDRAAVAGNLEVSFSSPAAKRMAARVVQPEGAEVLTCKGKDGTLWSIETLPGDASARRKIVQRSADNSEILRELEFEAGDPQPAAIAASPDRDEIILLERDASQIRLRGLRLKKVENGADGKAVSEWELFVSKAIHLFPSFEKFLPHLGRTPAPQAVEKLRVSLVPNELLSVAPAAVQLSVAIDEKGSFLRSSDGLFLRRVTDTPQLRWGTLATEPDGVVSLFQWDGAAVEEFRLGKLDQMMAFDAGEYDLAAPK
jgi:hypothetical protein